MYLLSWWAGWENIWPVVMAYGPSATTELRSNETRRQVAATGLCDKSLRVYYLQNKSLRHDACSVHTQWSRNSIWRSLIGSYIFCRSDLLPMCTHGATTLLSLILSLRSVKQIQTGLNSSNWSRRQNSAIVTMIFTKVTVSHETNFCGDL